MAKAHAGFFPPGFEGLSAFKTKTGRSSLRQSAHIDNNVDWSINYGYHFPLSKERRQEVEFDRMVDAEKGIDEAITFRAHSSDNERYAEALDWADKAFNNKSNKVAAVNVALGHIRKVEYVAGGYQTLRVTFANGDVTIFFRIPPSLGRLLLHLARDNYAVGKKANGEDKHILGVRFWDLVRIRGHKYGAKYPYEYEHRAPRAPKKYSDANRHIVEVTADNINIIYGALAGTGTRPDVFKLKLMREGYVTAGSKFSVILNDEEYEEYGKEFAAIYGVNTPDENIDINSDIGAKAINIIDKETGKNTRDFMGRSYDAKLGSDEWLDTLSPEKTKAKAELERIIENVQKQKRAYTTEEHAKLDELESIISGRSKDAIAERRNTQNVADSTTRSQQLMQDLISQVEAKRDAMLSSAEYYNTRAAVTNDLGGKYFKKDGTERSDFADKVTLETLRRLAADKNSANHDLIAALDLRSGALNPKADYTDRGLKRLAKAAADFNGDAWYSIGGDKRAYVKATELVQTWKSDYFPAAYTSTDTYKIWSVNDLRKMLDYTDNGKGLTEAHKQIYRKYIQNEEFDLALNFLQSHGRILDFKDGKKHPKQVNYAGNDDKLELNGGE